jgi:ribonuclease P protein component
LNKVHPHSLRKHEILRKKQLISLLFRSGTRVSGEFIKMIYADLQPENSSFQDIPAILFAVSKKTVPSAVQRNRVKRMLREAYRFEKLLLPERENNPDVDCKERLLCIAFLYTGRKKNIPGHEAFRSEMRKLIQSLRLS